MALSAGTRLGPYEITGTLGAGGMGEVYRARDAKLGRDVALKVLPQQVERDRDAISRFAREARLLASLDHPNIGGVYGWEESGGVHAIVLELVEGQTLRDRIAAGPLGIDEALKIARQIAEALDAAHERGVVHRDLKPANIKIRPDGRVKVLDFGLAKALAPEPRPGDATTTMATEPGLVVGTPAYMSPEQARGEPVTRSTDVWSFGVVLFEMLTNRHPFGGASTTDTLAAILRETPDWDALPRKTPAALMRLLHRCLEKDTHSRLRDIGDARLDIDEARGALSGASSGARRAAADVAGVRPWSAGARLALAAGALAVVAAVASGAYLFGRSRAAPPLPVTRLSVVPPMGKQFASTPAVSPDGRVLVFAAQNQDGKGRMLWLRDLSSGDARVLPGTDGAEYPFWKPDGKTLAFFADDKLKRLNPSGDDVPAVICDAPFGRGGTWLDDGTIVFSFTNSTAMAAPLYRVASSGGTPAPFTALAEGDRSHRFPQALPGGYLLYFVWSKEKSGLRLVSLDAPNKPLAFYPDYLAGEYLRGFLLSSRDDRIRAQRLNLPSGQLSGDAVSVAETRSAEVLGRNAWSSSPAGVIAVLGPVEEIEQLAWVSRDGRVLRTLGEPVRGQRGVELSPSGQQIAVSRADTWQWAIDADSGAATLVSKVPGEHRVWSANGTTLAFLSQKPPPTNSAWAIRTVLSNGTGQDALLLPSPTALVKPIAWTPDGKTFVWVQGGTKGFDIWTMPVDDVSKASPYLQDGNSPEGRLSPNGNWLAYANDRSGTVEVYVQRFPTHSPPIRVSVQGGRFPRWRADGRELYFLAGDTLMSASVTPGDPPVFGKPEVRFEMKLVTNPNPLVYGNYEYDVNKDESRFIVDRVVGETSPTLDVITNWTGGGS